MIEDWTAPVTQETTEPPKATGEGLRAMAEILDAHALDLAEADDYEGAKLVVETAMAFEARFQQIKLAQFNPRGVVDDR
ncbi:hypothetical protein ACT89R_01850 [Rhodococcus qingshengii]